MIRNSHILKEFEDSFTRKEGQLPPQRAFDIFSSMWQEALHMGVIPFNDPLAEIETDIKMVRILNLCLKK
jgi:hypothetical protein